jgi:serine/threonine protein phosphatase PrpC
MMPIKLDFVKDKREGYGEDSIPLSLIAGDFYAVGVFDGMGGSGAATCNSEYGEGHTKAYVASRIIKDAISTLFNTEEDKSKITSGSIYSRAKGRLEQEKANFPVKASGLRSKLIREYPTTLAVTTAQKLCQDEYEVNSYWAGDSRNYYWNSEGLFQISKDDLNNDLDPLENLRNDGALSNCVCADREFHINNKKFKSDKGFVILSATDGCFGYLPTPMHFHNLLLENLRLSENEDEWKQRVEKSISLVAGDDISLSLIAIGFDTFEELKTTLDNNIGGLEDIQALENKIVELSTELEHKKGELEKTIQNGWSIYKKLYMKYIVDTDDITPLAIVEGKKEEPSDISSEKSTKSLSTVVAKENPKDCKEIDSSNREHVSAEAHNSSSDEKKDKVSVTEKMKGAIHQFFCFNK